jgi:hypothetical protein
LHEAERVGITVRPEVWQRGLAYWLRLQRDDGSWGYTARQASTGSMTCAGISSLIICSATVNAGDAAVVDGRVQCCRPQVDDEALERGLAWMGRKFSATRNPSPFNLDYRYHYYFYYMYALERTGRLSGRRFLGRHDWYREGADVLIGQQQEVRGLWQGESGKESNPLLATSFALLFLSKGRRPVVVAKLKHGEGADWDRHRSAVGNLTRRAEQRWQRDLTWQTIDIRAATLEDLLEAPVLFLSGREGFRFTREQKENLRSYINQGGFLLAEACCDGKAFDRDFRALVKELFPDSSLRLLPPDHPVWWAERKVDPRYMRPLYGIDACCRTSVVYCPEDLSCYWELDPGLRSTEYPQAIREEIEACLRTGENLLTYATNRELKNKLDRPQILRNRAATDLPERSVLYVPKLMHAGGGNDAPNALPNLLAFLSDQLELRVGIENRLVLASDPDLFEYPVLFMHGRRAFQFSPAQRKALATYVERGGLILADAICANAQFTDSFRREMEAIFPGSSLERIAPENPLFTRTYRGFDLKTVALRDPQTRTAEDPLRANVTQITPLLEGLQIDDRIGVVFSPYDISCALESGASLECKGYLKQDAAKLAANVILFALQQ